MKPLPPCLLALLLLLPNTAWPKNIDVHFKLHVPYNTTVEAEIKFGELVSLKIIPAERMKEVSLMLC